MTIAQRRRTALFAALGVLFGLAVFVGAEPAAATITSLTPSVARNDVPTTTKVKFTAPNSHYECGFTATLTYSGRRGDPSDTATSTIQAANDAPATGSTSCVAGFSTAAVAEGTFSLNFSQVGTGPADAGDYDVTIVGNTVKSADNLDGAVSRDSCLHCFTVKSAGPVGVTGVSPTVYGQGGDIPQFHVFGTNFERGSKLEFIYNGQVDDKVADVTGSGATVSEIIREVKIAPDAPQGVRGVRVRNRNGNISNVCTCFAVNGPPITSITPNGDFNDPVQDLTTVTFTGSEFGQGFPSLAYVSQDPGSSTASALSIPGQNVRNQSSSMVTADYDLRNAAPSAYAPTITSPDGSVNQCLCRFTVSQRAERKPVLVGMDSDPDTVGAQRTLPQNSTRTFTVTGQNFAKGVKLKFDPGQGVTETKPGVTATKVDFVSPTQLIATVAATVDAPSGERNVTAINTDSTPSATCNGCVFVIPGSTASPTPSASASPTPTRSSSPSASPSPTASPVPAGPPVVSGRFVPLSEPARVFDSRQTEQKLRSGLIELPLADRIPGTANGAVLNVAVTSATAPGYVVVYPSGTERPATSNVNFPASTSQANEVVTGLSTDKAVSLYLEAAKKGKGAVIVDMIGYFTTDPTDPDAGHINVGTPRRVLDTGQTSTPRRSGQVELNLGSVVPANTTAVTLNVTIDSPTQGGYVVVWPAGTPKPNTSNVNFGKGQTQSNEVMTRVGTNRRVLLSVDGGKNAPAARVIVDLIATVTPQNGSTTTSTGSPTPGPTRSPTKKPTTSRSPSASPTRSAAPTVPTSGTGGALVTFDSPIRALDTRGGAYNVGGTPGRKNGEILLTLPDDVPADANAVVLNLTATGADRPGWIAVYPGRTRNPGTSNLSFRAKQDQANEVVVAIGASRTVALYVGGPDTPLTYLIVDLAGYLTSDAKASTASASPSKTPSRAPSSSRSASPIASPTKTSTPTPEAPPTCSSTDVACRATHTPMATP